MDKKGIAIMISVLAIGSILAIWTIIAATNVNNNFERAVNGPATPSFDEVQKMCYDKLKEQGLDPLPQYSVNLCAGVVMDGLNK